MFESETYEERCWKAEAENARLREENEAYARNLRGNHAITGATYEHLIQERDRLRVELAAAQATIAEMREALTEVVDADECQDADGWLCFELSAEAYHRADAALSIQCNQDALHEAMDKEREECAAICDRFYERGMNPAECAGAIRARKEGK